MRRIISSWKKRTLVTLLVGLIQTASYAQVDSSHGWEFYRGNRFDGHSSEVGLADSWSAKGPPVLWSIDLGSGYSGFVGSGDRVFTQYQTLLGQFVVCLDARSGKKIWETRYDWAYQPGSMYPGPRSTPTISGDRLFYTTPHGSIGCLDLLTGETHWRVDLAKVHSAPSIAFGYACSPVCIDDKVIVPVGGKGASMVALNQEDGRLKWKSGDSDISYCSALPIEVGRRKLIVGYFKNDLVFFDLETGKILADLRVSTDYDEHSAWPIFREPYLWISGPFRAGCRLLELKFVDGRLYVRSVYTSDQMSHDVASSVLVGDHLYGFDLRDVQSKPHRPSRGQFTCLEFETGKVAWQNGSLGRRTMSGGTVSSRVESGDDHIGHASAIYVGDKLILLNDTGQLIVGRASPVGFEELTRATILGGEIGWTAPSLINKRLFARNQSKAVCVYLGDSAEIESVGEPIGFANDMEQPTLIPLAEIVLGTEPKYAMTAPGLDWLARWYWISMLLGWVMAPVGGVVLGKILWPVSTRNWVLMLALVAGLLGTTIAGKWQSVFIFSWPVVLYIVFEWLVCQLKSSDPSLKLRPWRARFAVVVFVVTCYGYFWLCRRLSLAFEWTFLLGFPAALPLLWLVKSRVQRGEPYSISQWLGSAVAFSMFYWVGAGVILWKYPLAG